MGKKKEWFLCDSRLTWNCTIACIVTVTVRTLSTVLELEVRLATEEEEKKLLQSRLEEVREEARQQQEQLRTELEKVRTR